MNKHRMPSTTHAMTRVIYDIRRAFPFDAPEAHICRSSCIGCSKKLLSFLETEIDDWQTKMEHGTAPKLGDIQQLSKMAKKIGKALEKNAILLTPVNV
ncbi:MAG: hypothetical protein K6L80_12760 [Agarilytica sp.]